MRCCSDGTLTVFAFAPTTTTFALDLPHCSISEGRATWRTHVNRAREAATTYKPFCCVALINKYTDFCLTLIRSHLTNNETSARIANRTLPLAAIPSWFFPFDFLTATSWSSTSSTTTNYDYGLYGLVNFYESWHWDDRCTEGFLDKKISSHSWLSSSRRVPVRKSSDPFSSSCSHTRFSPYPSCDRDKLLSYPKDIW